jgi:hypothetical protein
VENAYAVYLKKDRALESADLRVDISPSEFGFNYFQIGDIVSKIKSGGYLNGVKAEDISDEIRQHFHSGNHPVSDKFSVRLEISAGGYSSDLITRGDKVIALDTDERPHIDIRICRTDKEYAISEDEKREMFDIRDRIAEQFKPRPTPKIIQEISDLKGRIVLDPTVFEAIRYLGLTRLLKEAESKKDSDSNAIRKRIGQMEKCLDHLSGEFQERGHLIKSRDYGEGPLVVAARGFDGFVLKDGMLDQGTLSDMVRRMSGKENKDCIMIVPVVNMATSQPARMKR